MPYANENNEVSPWAPLPGCDPIDTPTTSGLVRDHVELYRAPDIPAVREHNRAAVERWKAESEQRLEHRRKRWREIKAASNVTENRRLAGYAKNTIDGIIKDVEAVQNGPY